MENFGLNEQGELNVLFSRLDIASIAGVPREQAVRQLSDFEEEGYISKHSRRIAILNPEGLSELISNHNLLRPFSN